MNDTQLYKVVKSIKNDRFEVDDLHHYSLSLVLGARDLQMLVVDSRDKQCLLLEDFILPEHESLDDKIQILSSIFDTHHLLMAGFWHSVKFAFKNKCFTLVPCSLFDEELAPEYLKNVHDISKESEYYFSYKLNYAEAACVFSVEKKLVHWIRSQYPNLHIQILHQSAALLEGLLSLEKHENATKVNFFIDRFLLHVCIYQDNKLKYYNQFPIKQFDDYVKYSNIALSEFGIDQEVPISLVGIIKEGSSHLQELRRFYPNIFTLPKANFAKMSYHFDEIEDHQYFDLLAINICE